MKGFICAIDWLGSDVSEAAGASLVTIYLDWEKKRNQYYLGKKNS